VVKDFRPGIRQPDRKTLLKMAEQGVAVLWCTACDFFWREFSDKKLGWVVVINGQEVSNPPGHSGCPKCGHIYVVWENYPEWEKLS